MRIQGWRKTGKDNWEHVVSKRRIRVEPAGQYRWSLDRGDRTVFFTSKKRATEEAIYFMRDNPTFRRR